MSRVLRLIVGEYRNRMFISTLGWWIVVDYGGWQPSVSAYEGPTCLTVAQWTERGWKNVQEHRLEVPDAEQHGGT